MSSSEKTPSKGTKDNEGTAKMPTSIGKRISLSLEKLGGNKHVSISIAPKPSKQTNTQAAITQWTTAGRMKKSSQHTITDLTKGSEDPPDNVREQLAYQYTSYCQFSQGHQRKQTKSKIDFVMHVFNILKGQEPSIAIQPYDNDSTANSIAYAKHVPKEEKEFQIYFPAVWYERGQLTTKCRITSQTPLSKVKHKAMPSLRGQHYFLRPSQLKARQTAKVGWFYLCHADLSHRSDFHKWLYPVVEKMAGKKIEFQVEPELEKVTIGEVTKTQRVLTARCAVENIDRLRELLVEIFDPNCQESIGPLARYIFVLTLPMGHCSEVHLQQMIVAQDTFRKNVVHFVVFGMCNIEAECELLALPPSPSQEENDTPTKTETTTLRRILYEIKENNEVLFHAVYPSADERKTFILCKYKHKEKVLQLLHDMESLVTTMFVEESRTTYFPREAQPFFIKDNPKMSQKFASYASRIVDMAGSNPNEPPEEVRVSGRAQSYSEASSSMSSNTQNDRGEKRKRKIKEASNGSNLPEGFMLLAETTRQNENALKQTMESLAELKTTESARDERLSTIETRLNKQGEEISVIGRVVQGQGDTLKILTGIQQSQARDMKRIADRQDDIFNKMDLDIEDDVDSPNDERAMQE